MLLTTIGQATASLTSSATR